MGASAQSWQQCMLLRLPDKGATMTDDEIDTAKLLIRLLAVMPVCWLDVFVRSLEEIVNDTGHGRAEVEVYRKHIVQVNQVMKNRR